MNEETIKTTRVFEGRLLKIDEVEVVLENGHRASREVIRHPGAAVILAQRDDGRFVFVRQYRKAIDRETLEVVAGTLHRGEDPAECARRELQEETGYTARELVPIGAAVPAPGYTDERLYLFHARVANEAGASNPDDDEKVQAQILTANEIETMIAGGGIEDAKTMAAWLLYRLRLAPRKDA